ncbi:PEGA domain-containing protein [Patescibacteria group bacterium]
MRNWHLPLMLVMVFVTIMIAGCGQERTPVEPEPALGSVVVTTTPDGAQIGWNYNNTEEVTPHTFTEIEPGRYMLLLRKDGYADWYGTVCVKPGVTVPAHIDLEPFPQ